MPYLLSLWSTPFLQTLSKAFDTSKNMNFTIICLSRVETVEVEVGQWRKFPWSYEPPLCICTTFALFHSDSIFPWLIHSWKKDLRNPEMEPAHFLSIKFVIPSAPQADFVLLLLITFIIFSSVISIVDMVGMSSTYCSGSGSSLWVFHTRDCSKVGIQQVGLFQ